MTRHCQRQPDHFGPTILHALVAYQINVAPQATPAVPYRSWAEIGEATRARGNANLSGWAQSNGNYAQLALLSLAALVDVTNSAEARSVFQWLASAGAPHTRVEDYAQDPTSNVVPRGMRRVAGPATSCGPRPR